MEIGQLLKKIRKEKELTQAQLAHNIMSRSHLSELENGNYFPSYDKFLQLLEALNVSPNEFDYLQKQNSSQEFPLVDQIKRALITNDVEQLEKLTDSNDHPDGFNQNLNDYQLTATARIALDRGQSSPDYNVITNKLSRIEHWYTADVEFLYHNIPLLSPRVASFYGAEALQSAVASEDLNTIRLSLSLFQQINIRALQTANYNLVFANTQDVLSVTQKYRLVYERYLAEINYVLAQNGIRQNTSPLLLEKLTTLQNWGYSDDVFKIIDNVVDRHIPICNDVLTLAQKL